MRVLETKSEIERVDNTGDTAWFQFDTYVEYIPEDGKAYESRSLKDKLEGHIFLGEDDKHRLTIRRAVAINLDKGYNTYWIRQDLLAGQFSLEELRTVAGFLNQFVTAVEDGSIHNDSEEEEN